MAFKKTKFFVTKSCENRFRLFLLCLSLLHGPLVINSAEENTIWIFWLNSSRKNSRNFVSFSKINENNLINLIGAHSFHRTSWERSHTHLFCWFNQIDCRKSNFPFTNKNNSQIPKTYFADSKQWGLSHSLLVFCLRN